MDAARQVVLIVNPVAGGGRGGRVLERALPVFREHGMEPRVIVSNSPAEPRAAAQAAARGGADVIVAVGGDGHAAAVADGMVGSDSAFALLPAGSANDYAKSLGMPRRDIAASVGYIVRNRQALVDTMLLANDAGTRHFLNVIGTGFDAAVAARAEQFAHLRGAGRYVLSILRVLPGYRPTPLRLTIDDRPHEVRAMMVAVANGTSYGGGMRVAPDARLDSGQLEVCIVGDVGTLEFVRAFPRVFRGTHVSHSKVTMLRGRTVTLESDQPLGVIGDGEFAGALPASVEIVPASLRVVVGGRDPRTQAVAERKD